MAIALRLSGVNLSALAVPPLRPPSLPNATAAAFFLGVGLRVSPIACSTTRKAFCAGSDMLDRLGISL